MSFEDISSSSSSPHLPPPLPPPLLSPPPPLHLLQKKTSSDEMKLDNNDYGSRMFYCYEPGGRIFLFSISFRFLRTLNSAISFGIAGLLLS